MKPHIFLARALALSGLCGLLCLTGCAGDQKTRAITSDQPISIEAWRELEIVEKYAPETLDRLRSNDPRLELEKNWDAFMRNVIVPERRKDIPTNY